MKTTEYWCGELNIYPSGVKAIQDDARADLLAEVERRKGEILALTASQQMCVGAAGIGDFSELCEWIDGVRAKLAAETARADSWESCVRAAVTSKSPCGHLANFAVTEDGGKHIYCLKCQLETQAARADKAEACCAGAGSHIRILLNEIRHAGLNETSHQRAAQFHLDHSSYGQDYEHKSARERVEAACAQKNAALELCTHVPLPEKEHHAVVAALDDSCGTGYGPVEAWRPVVESLEAAREALNEAAAYGSCSCDIPNDDLCITCQCSNALKAATEALTLAKQLMGDKPTEEPKP